MKIHKIHLAYSLALTLLLALLSLAFISSSQARPASQPPAASGAVFMEVTNDYKQNVVINLNAIAHYQSYGNQNNLTFVRFAPESVGMNGGFQIINIPYGEFTAIIKAHHKFIPNPKPAPKADSPGT